MIKNALGAVLREGSAHLCLHTTLTLNQAERDFVVSQAARGGRVQAFGPTIQVSTKSALDSTMEASDVSWMADQRKWKGLRSLIMVERQREVGGVTGRETFFSAARGHWGIENPLH